MALIPVGDEEDMFLFCSDEVNECWPLLDSLIHLGGVPISKASFRNAGMC
jgi:hypothetical protein